MWQGEETFRRIESGCLREAGIGSGDKCDSKHLLNVFCLPDPVIYLAFNRKKDIIPAPLGLLSNLCCITYWSTWYINIKGYWIWGSHTKMVGFSRRQSWRLMDGFSDWLIGWLVNWGILLHGLKRKRKCRSKRRHKQNKLRVNNTDIINKEIWGNVEGSSCR